MVLFPLPRLLQDGKENAKRNVGKKKKHNHCERMNEQIQELKFKCPEKKDRNFEKGETKSEPCVGSELQLMTK